MIVFNRRILFLCRPPPPFDMCPMVLQNTHPFLETLRGITSPSHFFRSSFSSTGGKQSPRAWRSCLRLVCAPTAVRRQGRPPPSPFLPLIFSPPTHLFLSQQDRALEAMPTIGTFLVCRGQQHRCRETSFCNNMRATTYCSFFYCFGNKLFVAKETSATLRLCKGATTKFILYRKGLVSET